MSGKTNLDDGHQVRHVLKVVGREIGITPRLDFLQSLVDLCPQFFLAVAVLGQFPEPESQLENS